MLLSRRKTLVGTAATLSALVAPAALAQRALPQTPAPLAPILAYEQIAESPSLFALGDCPTEMEFRDSENVLVGICQMPAHSADASAFYMAWHFMHAARFARGSDVALREAFFALEQDGREYLEIPAGIADVLNVSLGRSPLTYYKQEDWITLATRDYTGGTIIVRRRAWIGA